MGTSLVESKAAWVQHEGAGWLPRREEGKIESTDSWFCGAGLSASLICSNVGGSGRRKWWEKKGCRWVDGKLVWWIDFLYVGKLRLLTL